MTRYASSTRFLLAGLATTLFALLLPGCDNPACVFGGTCAPTGGAGGGGIGSEAATIPSEGEELLAAAPVLRKSFPTGTTADPKTPIVLQYSESMGSNALASAFELQAPGIGALPLQAVQLLGDGHLIVLFPLSDLALNQEYTIQYRQGVKVVDRTGQLVVQPADRVIGTFTTAAAAPAAPAVLTTWPEDAATNKSPTGEIDVVFTRKVDASTVTDPSWVVTVAGVAPTNDPVAQPVTLSGVLPDTRAYRWRSVDASSVPVSLGTNVEVQLELSPTGQLIRDEAGNALPNKKIKYRTLPFSPPTAAAITSAPTDAIGIQQISGAADLAVKVDFADAQAGDRLGLYMFGKEPQSNPPVPVQNLRTIALLREFVLETPFTTFTLTAGEIDLVRTASPLAGRFTDGSVTFAFYVKRGSNVSSLKLLDVDTTTKGTQSPVLDTVAPTLLGLSSSGCVANVFRSDQRDLVIVGRANESLRAVAVTTTLGDNEITMGQPAPVVGSTSGGLFVAAPVRVGVLTAAQQPLTYSVTLYDKALNATTPATGQFTQVGAGSNGAAGPFTNVFVEVVNAVTLAPVVNATVYVHENVAGSVSFVGSAVTDVNGRATLTPPLIGEAIVTVNATNQGFDLFTFDGLPTDRLSVPLQPNAQATASIDGSVSTTDQGFSAYLKGVADTRFVTPGETVISTGSCALSTQTSSLNCNYGPTPIRARQLGAQTAVVVLEPSSPFLYSALTFLKGFSLSIPAAPVEPGVTQTNVLSTGTSLDAGTLDPEERPIDVPPVGLATTNFPALIGTPRVRVEANSPGIARALTVGRGIAFDALPPNPLVVRAAYPGSCDPIADVVTDKLGRFVTSGTIEPLLRLRMECVDSLGNRGGARPTLPTASSTFTALAPPTLQSIPFVQTLGSDALDVQFADVISDAAGQGGLYRVVLTDTVGTAWTVWAIDPPDSNGPVVSVRLPLIGAGVTLPLVSGDLRVTVSAFAWPTFDANEFLWSDVEREFDLFSHAASATVTPP